MVKNRVKEASEHAANNAIGNKVSFTYNPDNTTTFKYQKADASKAVQQETYIFDSVGRTTSVVNMDGSASTYKYKPSTTKSADANKITELAQTSASVNNILLDHNAERNNGTWTGSNWSSPGGTFSVDSTAYWLGSKSLKIEQKGQTNPARSGAVQKLYNLTPGTTYTLSGYVKKDNVTGGSGANLYVAFFDSNNQGTGSVVNSSGLWGTNADWQRLSVSFTVPANTARVEVYGGLSYANGTAWFDCLQLETGSIANIYNMLENSDFRYSSNYQPTNWNSVNFTSGDGMENGYLKINGKTNLNKNIWQEVFINKPANNIAFVVSSKSIGKSVPINKSERHYAIDVKICFTDKTYQLATIPFNPDTTGEQYTSGPIKANKDNRGKTISKLVYHVAYDKNANDAKFKFLQMNMDETGSSYVYDEKTGKIVSSEQNAKNNQSYSYSDAKELLTSKSEFRTKDSNENINQNYTYKYDETGGKPHRLLTARSNQTNIGFNYGYDSYGNVTNTKMGSFTDGNFDSNKPYIEGAQKYNSTGNYVVSSTDQRGKTISYDVNPTTGLTNSITDPKLNKTEYKYDEKSNLLTSVRAAGSAGDVVNSYGYDTADRINKITHNGFDYTFQRDGYGNTTIINVGTQNLITHIFGSGNGNLLSSNYGNGFKLSYFYDDYDRVTSVIKNGATAYIYGYDSRGNLAKVTDKTNGSNLVTDLSYDVGDRLIKKSASDGSEIKYCYDTMDRPTSLTYNFAGESKSTTFGYKEDNRKGTTILPTNGTVTREYDSLNREFKTDVNDVKAQEPTLRTLKTYLNVSGNRTTNLIDKYNNIHHNGAADILLSTYKYTYDDNGNISTITDEDNKETKYTYDGLNQLVRVDDQKNNISTTYSYDQGGNITQVKTYDYTTETLGTQREAVNYSYGNANWRDLLTDYNGQSITYDAIGNPLSYRNDMSFTWEGRQLKTAVANGKT